MEPKIVKRDQFTIVGMEYIGNNAQGEIPQMWGKLFSGPAQQIRNVTGHAWYGFCECMCEGECTCGQGADFGYIAGTEVSSTDDIPEGMVSKTIPAAKYAVFTHRGSLEAFHKTMEHIFTKWLSEAGLTPSDKYCFEYYDERFKDFAEDSELDIYVPIG